MVGDTIPPPSDAVTSPKHDHPTPQGHPVPARPPPTSAPRKPAPPQPRRPPPAPTPSAAVTSPVSPTSPTGESGRPPQPKKRKEQDPPPPTGEAKVNEESVEQKQLEKEKEGMDSAVTKPVRKSPPAPPRQPAKRPPPPRKLPEKKPPISAVQQQEADLHTGAEVKPLAAATVPTAEAAVVPPGAAPPEAVTAVTKNVQRPSRPPQVRKPPPLPQSKPAAESPDIAVSTCDS